jgi:hypothetical protein
MNLCLRKEPRTVFIEGIVWQVLRKNLCFPGNPPNLVIEIFKKPVLTFSDI